MKKELLFMCLFLIKLSYSQIQTFYVLPYQTDTNYALHQDSSKILVNTNSVNNKLFLYLGGTGSSTSSSALLLNRAANLGYAVINLSYINNVAAASLSNDSDSLAFDKFREEICFGTPLSGSVTVDSLNSIYTRFFKLLQYLNINDASHNWGQYLSLATAINWDKIAIGGHSQGAGHSAYIAKRFLVDRVLMFAGPNDYSNYYVNSANWIRTIGTTPVSKQYAYLSFNDEIVDFYKQFVNITGLEMLQNDDTTYIDNIVSPYGNSNCLYTKQVPGAVVLNHSVPIKFTALNRDVWDYMLTDVSVTQVKELNDNYFSIYPNPANSFVNIQISNEIKDDAVIELINSTGKLLIKKKIIKSIVRIDISKLSIGVYYLKIGNKTKKVIKT